MRNTNNTQPKDHKEKDLRFEVVSWTRVYSFLLHLTELIQNSGFEPDLIVGVSRGGLIPARVLSDLLENSNLDTVATEFYVGVNETKPKPTLTQELSSSVDGKKVLLVDDLVDSGESLKLVFSYLKGKGASEVKTVVLYRKPWSVVGPDYCINETSSWVVFPWDHKETIRKLFEKFASQGISVDLIKEKLISFGLNKNLINQISEEKQ